jgi:hypothetical protein
MEYVHGYMDRVHGNKVHRLTEFIKSEPFKSRWMAQIHQAKGYVCFLISTVTGRMDGGDPTGHWGQLHWDTSTAAALAALHELAGAPLRASPRCADRVVQPNNAGT